jgi:3-dehydroquinate synthase
MAEVIKYAMIDRPVIFELIEKDDTEALIYECIDDKREKVEADECDNGIRHLLNLGHTFGHAIEKLENFKMSHGEAVAVGMTLITRYAVTQNMCAESDLDRLVNALNKYGLPTDTELNAKEIAGAAMGDKKRKGNTVTLVIPQGERGSALIPTATEDVEKILEIALRKDQK